MATQKTEGQKFKDCGPKYDEFKKVFSIERLDGLTIDNYAGGNGNRESFSYWLLHGLRGLGSINSMQNFRLFQVYYNKAGEIVYPRSYNSPEAAMDKIRQTIKDIAEYASNGEFEKIDEINFPESVKWKIAFVYAPGELNNKQLIPIYSQKELKEIASKVGMKNIGDNTQISEIHKYLIDNKPANEELSQYYEYLWKQSSRKEDKSEDVIKNTGTEPIDSPESKDKDSIMINDLNLIKCLQESSNIILHGAPGTGKTFLAKEIAKKLCGIKTDEELKNSKQFKMVQFHPSYDYTDFVEGLRPEDDGKGNIVFKRKDGVFKRFCKNTIKNTYNDSSALKQEWDKLFDEIKQKTNMADEVVLRLYTGKQSPRFVAENDRIRWRRSDGDLMPSHSISWDTILDVYNKLGSDIKVINNNISLNPDLIFANVTTNDCPYIWAIFNELYLRLIKEKTFFIFLIDEINRGDMSKIFGELFYAIDPGYRGEDGKIDTQYQNLVTAKYKDENGDEHEDPFYKGFYVPDNVYIIGTMNDIDRSVESMDFAMRRRFQFIEVTAESRADDIFKDKSGKTLPNAEDAKKMMTNLNNCIISKGIGLSRSYQIGGSYFKKFAAGKESAQSLWEYRIKGLLREYLRGDEESVVDDKIENKLKPAFNLNEGHKYDNKGNKIE